jgi:RNA polymerase sigma-70 factor, ECF subfamily
MRLICIVVREMETTTPNTSDSNQRSERFMRLLVQNEPVMRAYLRSLLPGWEDVQDVAQEASLVAWKKFDLFEEGTSFKGWLLTIARFEALKHRRTKAREPLVFSEEVWNLIAADAEKVGVSDQLHSSLEKCLGKLAPKMKKQVLQAHTKGVRTREIAADSGKSEQAFYKWIQRIRIKLLDCVQQTLAQQSQ